MNKFLYLNNFRGFQKTFISFKQVNFFVGENSSGKSSILALLKLMSTSQFWNTGEFNMEDIELGFFNELVSNTIIGKKSFQIAFHYEGQEDFERLFRTILVNFENDRGTPQITNIRLQLKNYNINIKIGPKQRRVQIKETPYICDSLETFTTWINDTKFDGIKFSVHPINEETYSSSQYVQIRDILKSKLPKDIRLSGYMFPKFLPLSTWIAPIRTKPKRIYESFKLIYSSEGDHTPLLIKSILSNQHKKHISREDFLVALEKFGKRSGLFDKIAIESLGADISSPFIVNIFLNGFPIKLTNVGYGVGQVLPLLAEILVAPSGKLFSIQQPEVHLHPRAQAALGDFIFEASKLRGQSFLIETHSDFIIDRFRYGIKSNKSKLESQVLFFERSKKGNSVFPIVIDEKGQYSEEQPKSFRDFFINEELNLLSI